MEDSVEKKLHDYLTSIDKLYEQVREWLHEEGLNEVTTEIVMEEARPGKYTANKMTVIDSSGKPLAEIAPKGAWIIGADGRVDVVGHVQSEVLVYWGSGSPEFDMPEPDNGTFRKERLFKDAVKTGWYWIEDKKFGRARPLTKQLLLDLIEEVQPL